MRLRSTLVTALAACALCAGWAFLSARRTPSATPQSGSSAPTSSASVAPDLAPRASLELSAACFDAFDAARDAARRAPTAPTRDAVVDETPPDRRFVPREGWNLEPTREQKLVALRAHPPWLTDGVPNAHILLASEDWNALHLDLDETARAELDARLTARRAEIAELEQTARAHREAALDRRIALGIAYPRRGDEAEVAERSSSSEPRERFVLYRGDDAEVDRLDAELQDLRLRTSHDVVEWLLELARVGK